jgi:hypothetical protein
MSATGSVAAVNAAARAAARAAGVAASTAAPGVTYALSNVLTLTTVPAPPKLAELPPLPRYFRKKSRVHPHFKLRKVSFQRPSPAVASPAHAVSRISSLLISLLQVYRWQDFAPFVDNIKIVYDPADDGARGCK